MALARVVAFEGVTTGRIEELEREISEGERAEGLDPTEMILLHDPEAEKSLVILLFEDEEAYRRGDAALDAMPAGETPGRRLSVTKYNVALRIEA
jgi:hypothetical protein